ncbi:MAG: 2-phosphosulfolactate phosphatase [Candidatus Tectomicrobia bacterium]|nr:2-phosphosulfolactate phosphatase [Candidatus Tectomicrobia bacterium]
MVLRVLFSRAEIPGVVREMGRAEAREAVWVAIDVLRATTTIVSAFEAGCGAIYPAASIAEARRLRRDARGGSRLLAGERNGRPIRGFDLGNSPREFVADRVAGRGIVLTTVNGIRTLQAAVEEGAREVRVASFANAGAAARRAAALARERGRGGGVNIVCSGRDARFCLEDAVCAGLVAEGIRGRGKGMELTDSALACWNLYQRHCGDLLGMLRESSWGRYLQGLGLGPDVEFCARTDWSRVVPVFAGGVIRPESGGR